jgi:hypothetical protein
LPSSSVSLSRRTVETVLFRFTPEDFGMPLSTPARDVGEAEMAKKKTDITNMQGPARSRDGEVLREGAGVAVGRRTVVWRGVSRQEESPERRGCSGFRV